MPYETPCPLATPPPRVPPAESKCLSVDMLTLERSLHNTLPLGKEELDPRYIKIQIDKGLLPPWEYKK